MPWDFDFSPDARWIVVAVREPDELYSFRSPRFKVVLYNTQTDLVTELVKYTSEEISRVMFTPDGTEIVVLKRGTVIVMNLAMHPSLSVSKTRSREVGW